MCHRGPAPRDALARKASVVCIADDLRDAEVDELHERGAVVALDEEHVGGLEVAVDDAGSVRLLEPVRGLLHETAGEERIEPPATREHPRQILPFQQLHHEKETQVGIGADIEYVNDVLALDGARAARLAFEAMDDLVVVGEQRLDQLDGDAFSEGDVLSLVDDRHAALAEDALDPVPAREHPTDGTRGVGFCRELPIARQSHLRGFKRSTKGGCARRGGSSSRS